MSAPTRSPTAEGARGRSAPLRLGCRVGGPREQPVRRRPGWLRAHRGRVGRYALTSVVATGVSEATLLELYGAHLLGASAAAVAASAAGVIPSYLLSRYWIWPEADRHRPGRQALAFWVVALISLGLSTLLTGMAAANSPSGHLTHLAVVGVAYVGTYGVLWVAKFAVYQRYLFRTVGGLGDSDAVSVPPR